MWKMGWHTVCKTLCVSARAFWSPVCKKANTILARAPPFFPVERIERIWVRETNKWTAAWFDISSIQVLLIIYVAIAKRSLLISVTCTSWHYCTNSWCCVPRSQRFFKEAPARGEEVGASILCNNLLYNKRVSANALELLNRNNVKTRAFIDPNLWYSSQQWAAIT